ncbi:heavy metal RND efflux outer membrane protein, CzcC family [Candidatus Kuenenia stuttgartiensis]|jgi:cobalt-zinc-cadmium efflux system outer membrane protein|uniref:Heavy metal RND efflux outer membrane protein, CzcC family n=1 Tax=Kuenenia stuttgartiensis TaxID=174633 RepID=Q1Q5T7_KUEST|nr:MULTISPECIES: TolC family protein [Kuenenia]MBE7549259.1 TolC family protein [Planctomycetia bacterium]MBZ0192189.1 TolC family protein [Candidatus Kuenenia stuttgartiensis]MCF6153347.1 TolC family protein [Candidatus Kuenenia stuttgartiensis]MCL4727590.1 TolC family protein [Candidatus Kuenenia stuttgartiensis]MCZ7624049.1 TolC family protein [Candidatus Kuenenia sp.]
MNFLKILSIAIHLFIVTHFAISFNTTLVIASDLEFKQKEKHLTIEDAVNIAINNNPIIMSKKHTVGAAQGKIKQAQLMPNPEITLLTEEIPTEEIGLNQSQNMVSLSQKLEIGGKRGLRTDVAKKEKNILSFDVQTTIWNITAQTKKAFFDLLTAQDELNLAKKTVEIAMSLKNLSDKKFKVGDISKLGVLKAEVELSNAKTTVVEAERNMFNATKRLQTVMGTTGAPLQKLVPIPVTDAPLLKLEKLEELSLKNYPELQAQKSIVNLSLLKVKEAKRKMIPDIDVSIGYKRLSATDDDTIQAGISLPLPFFNRNQGNIIEAKELSHKSKDDEAAARNKLLLQLDNAYSMYASTRELVRSFIDTIVPQAEESLKMSKQGYEHGEFDFLEVLDAQRTLVTANVSYLKALNDLFTSITEIERLVGVKISDIK